MTAQRAEGCGSAMEPLRGSGSEGSKGSSRFQRAGSEGCGSDLSGDEFICRLRRQENRTTGLRPVVKVFAAIGSAAAAGGIYNFL